MEVLQAIKNYTEHGPIIKSINRLRSFVLLVPSAWNNFTLVLCTSLFILSFLSQLREVLFDRTKVAPMPHTDSVILYPLAIF